MLEYHLIKAMRDPDVYQRWAKEVNADSMSEPAHYVWQVMVDYYSKTQTPGIQTPDEWVSSLRTYQAAVFSSWAEDKQAMVVVGFDQLAALEVELEFSTLMRTWIERDIAAAIALTADRFIEKPESMKKGFLSYLETQASRLSVASAAFQSDDGINDDLHSDFEQVIENLSAKGDLNWRLECLQQAVGSLYPGMFVVIGGRPESGKTTLLASEVGYMVLQLPEDGVVAFFNNEQSGDAVRMRLMQAIIGAPIDKIRKYPAKATEKFNELMGSRKLMVMNVHNQGIREVEQRLAQLGDKVGLIVFDQASKLSGLEKQSGNDAERLQKLGSRLKGLASLVAPVFTTIWADGSAEGDKWIGMNQLYGSKTGIPGEAEVIINVGYSKEECDKGYRFLNIPKNKSITCQDERLRHSDWPVVIKHEIARMEDPKR